ncbi:DNA-methyltransferase [Rothia nasimurium]|uniref:DNA-methyltransferase n=1 Tax=Rothia nasimurium TaxID=85336 RepID=UPI001F24220D|nr:DNA methyltransferase [Rothia nasimurium]
MTYEILNINAFHWLQEREPESVQAVVTDPPYGVREYLPDELHKQRIGYGGIWRIPNTIGGSKRLPSPRFSVINDDARLREDLENFFRDLSKLLNKVLVPGGHVILASTPLLSDLVCKTFRDSGFEKRGEVVRVVKTLRGGDRPKNHEEEFSNVTVIPRGHWEPWLVFRKPISEKTVAENLRKWSTGGLQRISDEKPFSDLIISEKANSLERSFHSHTSIKPQSFMRQIVKAALPLGQGLILDPFSGSGSTIAAAEYLGLSSIGLELDRIYYEESVNSIKILSKLSEHEIKTLKPKKN